MNTIKEYIVQLLEQDKKLRTNQTLSKLSALPENCYYLKDDAIMCYPRKNGDGRYPYSADGFTLWAHSSGYLSLNESTFYYILPANEGKEPYAAFFGGIKGKGGYTPVSITGVARQAIEKGVKRFTVYTPQAVYYVTQTKQVVFFVRAFMSENKQAIFTVGAFNRGKQDAEVYLSTYINFLLMHQAGESIETAWFKKSTLTEYGYLLEGIEDLDRYTHLKNYGVVNRSVKANVAYEEHTCSRSDYVGGKVNSLSCATPLFTGHFEKQAKICNFGDTAIIGDLYAVNLKQGDCATIDYVVETCSSLSDAQSAVRNIGDSFADDILSDAIEKYKAKYNDDGMLRISFANSTEEKINANIFTEFVSHVQRQVEFAALAKNSGVSLLGVRDVTQQLEAALMWNAPACRNKFIEVLSFLDPSGRAPRQYSIPASGAVPRMDTREFIDQGNWIISAIFTYLSYTNDYSILDEVCGYYKIVGANCVQAVDEKNTVFEHIVRIADYLINNIDEETHCLKILYGDWNDAVDGLGISDDPTKEYGSGVSMMATLHLYQNLKELIAITEKYGDKFDQLERYRNARKQVEEGIVRFGIEERDGVRKFLHGWGDKRSYKVGSFDDLDGLSRDGLTANAFWVISDAYLLDKSIKQDILTSYDNLDSKYGLRTFYPSFAEDVKGVGRIVNLPAGTAENGATYIHATMFGIWSLFGMGEGERAWEQLKKVLPITHSYLTTTPFIMSNSYSFNEELGLDGESMSDWFTGSANALMKIIVRYIFGIRCDLDGIKINPSAYMPFEKATISIKIKGKIVKLNYKKCGQTTRSFTLNGKAVDTFTDDATEAPAIYVDAKNLKKVNVIKVFD